MLAHMGLKPAPTKGWAFVAAVLTRAGLKGAPTKGGTFVAALLLLGVMSAPALAEKRVALVIGNDRYDALPALQKAVNDARAVGERFQRLGYEVIRVENAPRRVMNEKISELTARIG